MGEGVLACLAPAMGAQLAQRCSPQTIAIATFLALPTASLADLVDRELDSNPALVRAEVRRRCRVCGDRGCGGCGRWGAAGPSAIDHLASPTSVRDQLFDDAVPAIDPADRWLLRLVVDSLDEHGLLPAEDRSALPDRSGGVDRVIDVLRSVAGPGIAAPDATSAVLLELDDHGDDPRAGIARSIIAHHLERVAAGELAAVAVDLGVSRELVADTVAWIRTSLRLFPMQLDGCDAHVPSAPPEVAVFDHPSRPGHLVVEVLERRHLGLRIDESYRRMATSCPVAAEHVTAASSLLVRLDQRWATLGRVATAAVRTQRSWITGQGSLRDLTRAEVARRLGCHESTVSRAVAGRRMLLPDGRAIAMAELFQSGADVRHVLRGLVTEEVHPLSDAQLAAALRCRGFDVARRTVAKYRAQLGIAPAASRCRATTP